MEIKFTQKRALIVISSLLDIIFLTIALENNVNFFLN